MVPIMGDGLYLDKYVKQEWKNGVVYNLFQCLTHGKKELCNSAGHNLIKWVTFVWFFGVLYEFNCDKNDCNLNKSHNGYESPYNSGVGM